MYLSRRTIEQEGIKNKKGNPVSLQGDYNSTKKQNAPIGNHTEWPKN